MDFNLFTWIRQGVRQSVLLGVSDAIEQIGTPEGDELSPKLSEAINQSRIAQKSAGGPKRKRLGKSLKDLGTTQ